MKTEWRWWHWTPSILAVLVIGLILGQGYTRAQEPAQGHIVEVGDCPREEVYHHATDGNLSCYDCEGNYICGSREVTLLCPDGMVCVSGELTTEWTGVLLGGEMTGDFCWDGQDLLACLEGGFEIGLRSDGVVVWREAPDEGE